MPGLPSEVTTKDTATPVSTEAAGIGGVGQVGHTDDDGSGEQRAAKGEDRYSDKAEKHAGMEEHDDRAERRAGGDAEKVWVSELVARHRLKRRSDDCKAGADDCSEDDLREANFPNNVVTAGRPGDLDAAGAR